MAGRFSDQDDFSIPSELFDSHEWMADSLIDGETGRDCTVVYPPTDSECPNCVFDPVTGRSANIYKTGGLYPFENLTSCPLCGGFGRRTEPSTDTIRLRVYFGGSELVAAMKQFSKLGSTDFSAPEGLVFVIGYIYDRSKLERANNIMIPNPGAEDIPTIKIASTIPWGFRQNRYFGAMLKRD